MGLLRIRHHWSNLSCMHARTPQKWANTTYQGILFPPLLLKRIWFGSKISIAWGSLLWEYLEGVFLNDKHIFNGGATLSSCACIGLITNHCLWRKSQPFLVHLLYVYSSFSVFTFSSLYCYFITFSSNINNNSTYIITVAIKRFSNKAQQCL